MTVLADVLQLIGALVLCCPNGVGLAPGGRIAGAVTPAAISALAVTADGGAAWVGAIDGRVRRVTLEGGEPRDEREVGRLGGAVIGIALRPDGRAVVASDAGQIALVDGEPGAEGLALPFTRHAAGLQSIAVSSDGALLAAGASDGVVLAFDLGGESGPAQRAALAGHEGPVAAVAFAQGLIWSAGWDGTVRSWKLDPKSGGREQGRIDLGQRELTALAPATDGRLLLVAAFDGSVRTIDPRKPKAKPAALPARPHGEWVSALAAAPGAPLAVAVGAAESTLICFDPTRPAAVREVAQELAPAVAALLPGGRTALVGRFDGSLAQVEMPVEALREGRAEGPAEPSAEGGR